MRAFYGEKQVVLLNLHNRNLHTHTYSLMTLYTRENFNNISWINVNFQYNNFCIKKKSPSPFLRINNFFFLNINLHKQCTYLPKFYDGNEQTPTYDTKNKFYM